MGVTDNNSTEVKSPRRHDQTPYPRFGSSMSRVWSGRVQFSTGTGIPGFTLEFTFC